MLGKEAPVKLSVVTLKKKLAEQIPLRDDVLRKDEYEIIGWFSARLMGWRNGTGVAVLVVDHQRNDYACITGYRRDAGVHTRHSEEVPTHIYVT